MAFNPSYVENLSQSTSSTMGSATPGKAKGKRRRKAFVLKNRQRFDPPLFIPRTQLPKKYRSTTYAEIADPYRRMNLDENPVAKATTQRGNDGMSFVW